VVGTGVADLVVEVFSVVDIAVVVVGSEMNEAFTLNEFIHVMALNTFAYTPMCTESLLLQGLPNDTTP